MAEKKVPAIGEDVSHMMGEDVSALVGDDQPVSAPGGVIRADDRGIVQRTLESASELGPIPAAVVGAVKHGSNAVRQGGDMLRAGFNALVPENLEVDRPYQREGDAPAVSPDEELGMRAATVAEIATAAKGGLHAGRGAKSVAEAIPTRAKAGAQFEQIMAKVGDLPVDVSRPGDAALRVAQLAERGGSMPKVVRDFLRRATDPEKAEPTYREMRDFYSNISRLSADEMKRLTPVVRKEVGELRAALDKALADVAARGGQERTYRAAMRQYAIASRMRELAEKSVKYGAGVAGAGALYNVLRD